MKKSLKKTIWTKFSLALILFTLVCMVTFFIVNVISMNLKHAEKKAKVSAAINIGSSVIRNNFDRIFSDLTFLSTSDPVITYAKNPTNYNRQQLENEFIHFQNSSKMYDQIRFIDAHGMEKVRANYLKEGSTIVPLEKLQSKKGRYYFIGTAAINDDKIFVSPFDLNKERGKIEMPIKPTIRFAKPIRDEHGKFQGILVLNYFGGIFLNALRNHFANTPGKASLLNGNGFWLLSANPENEWGNILAHGKSFSEKHPNVWKNIKTKNNGIIKTKVGIFSFMKIQPIFNISTDVSNDNHFLDQWKIVVVNQPQSFSLESSTEINRFLPVFIFSYFIGAFLIFIWSRASAGKMLAERDLKHLNVALEAIVMDRTRDLTKRAKELEAIKNAVIFGMASLAEIRDQETGLHVKRTQEYTRMLAISLRKHPDFSQVLTDELIDMYAKTAPLHDIGKVGVPDAILLKEGPLTTAEFEEIKWHPTYGVQIIDRSIHNLKMELHSDEGLEFLSIAKDIVGGHHEKWDGSGYPLGLRGNEIPLAARIMALADVYDALSTERPYKAAFARGKVEEIILEGTGKHFDPRIIEAFVNIKDDFWSIKNQLSDDIIGGV